MPFMSGVRDLPTGLTSVGGSVGGYMPLRAGRHAPETERPAAIISKGCVVLAAVNTKVSSVAGDMLDHSRCECPRRQASRLTIASR